MKVLLQLVGLFIFISTNKNDPNTIKRANYTACAMCSVQCPSVRLHMAQGAVHILRQQLKQGRVNWNAYERLPKGARVH